MREFIYTLFNQKACFLKKKQLHIHVRSSQEEKRTMLRGFTYVHARQHTAVSHHILYARTASAISYSCVYRVRACSIYIIVFLQIMVTFSKLY